MAFILPCPLERSCEITLDGTEPKVVMNRTQEYDQDDRKRYLKRMEEITKIAICTIEENLKVKFVDKDRPGDSLSYLELGGVAHELGTLPMPGHCLTETGSVDENLKPADYNGVYVCDLSIFPMSPESNPSLTLAALSLRLSRHLVPRDTNRDLDPSTIWVVNHSGEMIKVWVSNYGDVARPASELKAKILPTGHDFRVTAKPEVDEAVMVFRCTKFPELQAEGSMPFTKEPELFVACPGLTPVKIT
ncbi:hypothetical protein FRB94_001617 [Tulasnella sp. JGI-2019a]|nr:hypothetical protein FRB93_011282 [Tulasnella sp. JGI-2019a]KAG9005326.1 hypothetical protein FRB94_001617 [Tulasnella sp. JGI-2019a]